MSAGGQIACILSLVGYSVSFATNDYADAENISDANGVRHFDQERLIRYN